MISIVNEKDDIIGIKPFSEAHKQGLIHREAYVYLLTPDGKVLLQKREDNGLWDHSAAGHLPSTESYIEGAKREFEEELGIKIRITDLKEIGYERMNTVKPDKKNFRFVKIYLVKKDIRIENFKTNPSEVKDIKYFDKSELLKLLQQPHLLTGSAKSLIEKYILSRM